MPAEPQKTRVLQVVLSLNPGGTEKLIADVVRRLRDKTPMAVCCLDEPGLWGQQLREEGVPVTALGRTPGFHPSLGPRVARVARQHGATVNHAHQYTPFVYSCLSRVSLGKIPVVFTEHGRLSDAPPSGKRRAVNRVLRLAASRVFAVSDDLKQFMVAEGFRQEQIGVIYNGISLQSSPAATDRTEVRAALGIDPNAWVVGTIARLDPVKDLATLLQAATVETHGRPMTLLVVGDGPERDRLQSLAVELGIERRVHFLGHRDDARRWLAGCDAYVNSSLSEGVSLTILEAMAACLPVIATAVGGTPEVVTDECGILVPARDKAALAQAIHRLSAAPDLARTLGMAGRKRVEDRFTIDRMVQDYSKIYAEVSS